jgi:putative tryptophan/tyrosine transport system substrate-binding protein
MPVIGFLNNATAESYAPFVAAFRRGLAQTGYTEGQNVTIDYRWGRNRPSQLAEAAKALVQMASRSSWPAAAIRPSTPPKRHR